MLTIAKDATIQADPAAVWRAWRPSFPRRIGRSLPNQLAAFERKVGSGA
jgi:hypothetical protein